MADETLPSVTPPAQASDPVVAPVSPATITPPEAAPATAAPEPIKAEPAPEVKTEAPKQEATVLGAEPPKPETKADAKPEDKKTEIKTDDKKPADGAEKTQPEGEKKAEGDQSDEPAPLPTYELTFPEGVTFDQEKLGTFTKEIGEFEKLTKADHAEVQKFAQQLVDRHISEVKETVERATKVAQEYWEKKSQEWRESFEKDPEIGGNRRDTTISAVHQFIRKFGGTEDQQKEIYNLLDTSRLGNHPAMLRLLSTANVAKQEGRPVPATTPVPAKKSITQRMYGKKK